MKTYSVELTSLDIMLITDALIEVGKQCGSVVTAQMTLELIEKVQKPLER